MSDDFTIPPLRVWRKDGQYWVRIDTLSVALIGIAHKMRAAGLEREAEFLDAVQGDIEDTVVRGGGPK